MTQAKRSTLVDAEGAHAGVDRAEIERRAAAGEFFWLDIHKPTPSDIALLEEVFAYHPLALEDTLNFDQRPKIEEYDDFVFLAVYGANGDDDGLVEVHCFFSETRLITVHRDDCPSFRELRRRGARRGLPFHEPALVLHAVVDALVDSFFPLLSDLDDRIDELEDAIFTHPSDAALQEIFKLKRHLATYRKVIAPQRDLFTRVAGGIASIPGVSEEVERYYRDVYDHLIRINDLIDSYRDLLTSSMDVYLSTVSNRLNSVMKRLTIVATIFMPLTWITGFFGMNFGTLVSGIEGLPAFLLFGLVSQVVAIVAMLLLFQRKGWM